MSSTRLSGMVARDPAPADVSAGGSGVPVPAPDPAPAAAPGNAAFDAPGTAAGGCLPGPTPQPLGALPWPAGMLLVAPGPDSDEVAADLLVGRLPERWPEHLGYFQAALDGDAAEAAALVTGDSELDHYNRAVLIGDQADWAELAGRCRGAMGALVATGRYSLGLSEAPPDPADARGEVLAMVESAWAAAALEVGDPGRAAPHLHAAVAAAESVGSPILAASLRLTLAELVRDQLGDPATAAREADQALARLPLTADRELRAQLQVTRALARQELAGSDRGALLAVVADLTEATKVFGEATHPELFAVCNQHLALAYLVLPMSDEGDRIRIGVAVNALRAALRVFTPQTHPVAWASTQLNLANALQYLPSAHQEANLEEAVQLYEELLRYRDPGADPLGYARILSNQGNALGHLGAFRDARERLSAAAGLFDAAGDQESAQAVAEILASLGAAEAAARACDDPPPPPPEA